MGIDFQIHRASVDISKGYRQFQKADSAVYKDNLDSAVSHLNKGLNCFASAQDHLVKAEDDAYNKAGNEIDKGNKQLQESINEYADGHADRGASHYEKAMESYDSALDIID
jgi:exonuclease VII small subunit